MKYYFLTIVILLFSSGIRSQIIDNKLNVEIGFNKQNYFGNSDCLSNISAQPYLIGDDIQSFSYHLGFDYKLNKLLSAGINFTTASFENWNYTGELNILNRESLEFLIFKPGIQLYIPKKLFNSIDISLALSPTVNRLKSNIAHEYTMLVLDYSGIEIDQVNEFEIKELYIGADLGLHLNMDINNSYGFFIKTGYNHIFMFNSYFEETSIRGYYYQLGVNIRLLLNKRYNY